mmetsp:Transcript_23181/g.56253  ORF Transcript_23181/g.56253 Transcript_23181/m.56253 type:complete len:224 (-) Transcript_23181:279-950(-)
MCFRGGMRSAVLRTAEAVGDYLRLFAIDKGVVSKLRDLACDFHRDNLLFERLHQLYGVHIVVEIAVRAERGCHLLERVGPIGLPEEYHVGGYVLNSGQQAGFLFVRPLSIGHKHQPRRKPFARLGFNFVARSLEWRPKIGPCPPLALHVLRQHVVYVPVDNRLGLQGKYYHRQPVAPPRPRDFVEERPVRGRQLIPRAAGHRPGAVQAQYEVKVLALLRVQGL